MQAIQITDHYVPGNTILPEDEKRGTDTLLPLSLRSASPVSPPSSASPASPPSIIVLGTNDVNDTTLFLNGLTQNIIIFYDLFESLGYRPYLLQNPQPSGSGINKKEFIRTHYRTTTASEMITYGLQVKLFMEIGMSLDPPTRTYLRSIGATIVKLYLGNILNIDVETIQYYPSMFFHHHIVGELDEIWTSPHYKQHLEYAAILNRTDLTRSRIVPYVWDSCFLTRYQTREMLEWVPPPSLSSSPSSPSSSSSSSPSPYSSSPYSSSPYSSSPYSLSPPLEPIQDIVIMDPNISFQKCSFYSVLLVEAYARRYPEWKGTLHIINGDRLHINSHAKNQLLPSLTLEKQGRIRYYPRMRIHDILLKYRSACFITHQWNNDYNYMTLELMYCQYPILHNSEGWKDYGYSYSINRWEEAIHTLHLALTQHNEQLSIYKSHTAQLLQRHSIYDPETRRRWKAVLEQACLSV